MSVESISLVLNHSKAVGTDKVVLLGIANHDGDGGAWPSIATLARYANVSTRSVSYAIAKLREMGELVVHLNKGGNQRTDPRHRPNYYEITISTGDFQATKSASSLRRSRHEAERVQATKPTSSKPSLEPSSTESVEDSTARPPESELSFADYCRRHPNESPRNLRWKFADPS